MTTNIAKKDLQDLQVYNLGELPDEDNDNDSSVEYDANKIDDPEEESVPEEEENDLREIQVDDDLNEPDAEEKDLAPTEIALPDDQDDKESDDEKD